MKYISTILVLLFSFVTGFSQKKFEGSIVYTVHEGNKDEELTAIFGGPGIKLKFRDGNEYDKEEIVINLDSGIVYTLDDLEKTFTAKYLTIKQSHQNRDLANKTIAGYTSKPVDMANDFGYLGYLSGAGGAFILYRSDSLFYPVPDKYAANPELVIVNNNNIVLGANINMGKSFAMDEDSISNESKNILSIEAREIKWQPIDEKEFLVPSDYTKFSYNDYPADTTLGIDSTAIPDTVLEMPVKPAQKSTPKQSSKPKTKTKVAADKDIHKPE